MDLEIFLQIVVVALGLWLSIGALRAVVSKKYLAPYVPTRRKDFEVINRLASLKEGEVFYDLGCGDGRLCRYIAERNPEAKVVGVEIFTPLYFWSRGTSIFKPRDNLIYIRGDALSQDLSGANVVYLFGRPETMSEELEGKLRELKPGARILSYAFRPPFKPTRSVKGQSGTEVFLYEL